MTKIVIDGFTVELSDQGVEAVKKLQGQLVDSDQKLVDSQKTHDSEMAAKDTALLDATAKIEKLEKEVVTSDQLEQMVADRNEIVKKAESMGFKDSKGKTNAEVIKGAVSVKFGDKLDGKSDDYIRSAFDLHTVDSNSDPLAGIFKDSEHKENINDADEAYNKANSEMENNWKGKE